MLFYLVVAMSLLGSAFAAAPQAPPDFSGQWETEPETPPARGGPGTPPTAPARGNMGSGWGSPITIAQDAKELRVEYTVFTRYDIQPPVRLRYALDGSETRNAVMIGHTSQERLSRAVWKEQSLEITTSYRAVQPDTGKPFTTEVVQRLSLASPTELVIEVTRSVAGNRPSATRTVYRKVP
jgi:hypothetical protein